VIIFISRKDSEQMGLWFGNVIGGEASKVVLHQSSLIDGIIGEMPIHAHPISMRMQNV
jgi:hypothetical protein